MKQQKYSISNHQILSTLSFKTLLAALLVSGLSLTQALHAQEPLIDLGAELAKIKQQTSSETVPEDPRFDENGQPLQPEISQTEKPNGHGHKGPQWGYSGDLAPAHWAKLAAEFSPCGAGKNQSPIDLREQTAVGAQGLADLDIRYRDVPLKILNNGHTIQVNYPLGSYIKIGGKRYELLQYHFHTPSEHQKEGFNYPMEVHLVHKDGDGNLAVIGILFQEGAENEHINTLLAHIPKEVDKLELHENVNLNPVNFLPPNTEFFKYSGSLTTPPCSEGVYWMVFKHPVEVSAKQVMAMNEIMGENARPVQAINSRAVLKSWLEAEPDTQLYEFY